MKRLHIYCHVVLHILLCGFSSSVLLQDLNSQTTIREGCREVPDYCTMPELQGFGLTNQTYHTARSIEIHIIASTVVPEQNLLAALQAATPEMSVFTEINRSTVVLTIPCLAQGEATARDYSNLFDLLTLAYPTSIGSLRDVDISTAPTVFSVFIPGDIKNKNYILDIANKRAISAAQIIWNRRPECFALTSTMQQHDSERLRGDFTFKTESDCKAVPGGGLECQTIKNDEKATDNTTCTSLDPGNTGCRICTPEYEKTCPGHTLGTDLYICTETCRRIPGPLCVPHHPCPRNWAYNASGDCVPCSPNSYRAGDAKNGCTVFAGDEASGVINKILHQKNTPLSNDITNVFSGGTIHAEWRLEFLNRNWESLAGFSEVLNRQMGFDFEVFNAEFSAPYSPESFNHTVIDTSRIWVWIFPVSSAIRNSFQRNLKSKTPDTPDRIQAISVTVILTIISILVIFTQFITKPANKTPEYDERSVRLKDAKSNVWIPLQDTRESRLF